MAAVAFVSFGCNKDAPDNGSTPVNPPVDETISPVAFSIAAGEVEKYSTVTLSTSTADATIYYLVVKGGDTAALTKDNYKTAGQYADPIEITENETIYAIAAKGEKVSEITSAAYTVVTPADSIQKWTAEATATAYSVYDYEDLAKLAEIVNGGTGLAGVTITQKRNIAINAAVLGDGFVEPAEVAAGEPNADLINFAGIGSKSNPFAGTYDGNGKKITGLYIYGGQQGLGFIGCLDNATVKNVIILDAAVINNNVSADGDGSDDDRFGGVVGMTLKKEGNTCTVENCLFVGTVGSQAAKDRGGAYEYIAGIIGRVEEKSTADVKNCYSLVKVYGDSSALVQKVSGTLNCTDSVGVTTGKSVYTNQPKVEGAKTTLDEEGGITKATIIETVKTACGIDLTDWFTKAGL